MAVLTADKKRLYDDSVDPVYEDFLVLASTKIYEGAAVSMPQNAKGSIGPLVREAQVFVGFAARRADNSGGAQGDIRCLVRQRGIIRELSVANSSQATPGGVAVYATDDNTFTTIASGGTQIGKVVKGTGTNLADVYFEGVGIRSV